MRYYVEGIQTIITTLACTALLLAAGPGYAQMSGADSRVMDQQPKSVLQGKPESGRKQVPFSAVSSGTGSSGTDRASKDNVNQSVSGLQEAGYHLEAIVGFLKAGGSKASEISHACLQKGYKGDQVYQALKLAGFSNETAADAVPKALRMKQSRSQGLSVEEMAGLGNVMAPGLGDGGDIVPLAIQQQAVITRARSGQSEQRVPQGMPREKGGTQNFNGLGNWNRFQDERFDSFGK